MEDPNNLDLPELEEKPEFPLIPIIVMVVAVGLLAVWILHGRKYSQGRDTAVAGLERQLTADMAALEQERQKVFDLTGQLESLKQALATGQIKDRQQAVADYNRLAAEQRAQRDKVTAMMSLYNDKVAKLHALQQ